jgi:hypothetical protein
MDMYLNLRSLVLAAVLLRSSPWAAPAPASP